MKKSLLILIFIFFSYFICHAQSSVCIGKGFEFIIHNAILTKVDSGNSNCLNILAQVNRIEDLNYIYFSQTSCKYIEYSISPNLNPLQKNYEELYAETINRPKGAIKIGKIIRLLNSRYPTKNFSIYGFIIEVSNRNICSSIEFRIK